jgi:tetratricopeptide (TPR) repeat protein
LAALFYLLAVVLYIKARLSSGSWAHSGVIGERGEGPNSRSRAFYVLSLLACVLSIKTKEIGFTVPFTVALVELVFFCPYVDTWKARFKPLLPFFLTLAIVPLTLFFDTGVAGGGGVTDELRSRQLAEAAALPMSVYVFTQFSVIVTYLGLFFYPAGLAIDYDYPLSYSFFDAGTFLSFLLLLGILALALYLLRASYRQAGLARQAGSARQTLTVESFMVPIQDVIFEHRLYLPGAGLVIAVVSGFYYLLGLLVRRSGPRATVAATCALLILVCPPLFVALDRRNSVWADELVLISDALAKNPGKARLYHARALVYSDRNMYDKALADSTKAVELGAASKDVFNNRGIAYSALGRYRESIEDFTSALAIAPGYPEAYFNRAISLTVLGEIDGALADYTMAITLRPDYGAALNNRGVLYARTGNTPMAVEDLGESCRGGYSDACVNLGVLKKGLEPE